jgi:hypothetical protein
VWLVIMLAIHEETLSALIGAAAVIGVELLRLAVDRRRRRSGARRTRRGDR